jgi:hypothetical protein
MQWERGFDTVNQGEKIIATDMQLTMLGGLDLPIYKIAWLVEPYEINPSMYEWIKTNHNLFNEVWYGDYDEN